MHDVSLELRLQMVADKVMVPGCEPTSAVSSIKLMNSIRRICRNSLVPVQEVLDAIPGSHIQYGYNYGAGTADGVRQRWLVLPPRSMECCVPAIDYYAIIRGLPGCEPEVDEKFDFCSTIGMGYCPSPDFKFAEKPRDDPYRPEGTMDPLQTTYY
jgi:hypothetical protein